VAPRTWAVGARGGWPRQPSARALVPARPALLRHHPPPHAPSPSHAGGGGAPGGGAGRLCGGCGLTSRPKGQPFELTNALLLTRIALDAASGSSGRMPARCCGARPPAGRRCRRTRRRGDAASGAAAGAPPAGAAATCGGAGAARARCGRRRPCHCAGHRPLCWCLDQGAAPQTRSACCRACGRNKGRGKRLAGADLAVWEAGAGRGRAFASLYRAPSCVAGAGWPSRRLPPARGARRAPPGATRPASRPAGGPLAKGPLAFVYTAGPLSRTRGPVPRPGPAAWGRARRRRGRRVSGFQRSPPAPSRR
jgi:hypothetical protein